MFHFHFVFLTNNEIRQIPSQGQTSFWKWVISVPRPWTCRKASRIFRKILAQFTTTTWRTFLSPVSSSQSVNHLLSFTALSNFPCFMESNSWLYLRKNFHLSTTLQLYNVYLWLRLDLVSEWVMWAGHSGQNKCDITNRLFLGKYVLNPCFFHVQELRGWLVGSFDSRQDSAKY